MKGKRLHQGEPERNEYRGSGAGTAQRRPMEPGRNEYRGSAAETPQRKPKPRPKKGKKIYRVLIAIIAVLLALCIGVLAWWKTFAQKPDVTTPTKDNDPSSDLGNLPEIGKPVRTSGDKKQDFYTFLVIGRDTGGGGNTDTILLVSYDKAKQEMNVMSIPRDTMVNVSWDVKKINSVYNNYGAGDKGIDALGEEISQLVGFVPDFQVVLEWKAVGELVDALGGVTYDVPRNMYYVDPTQNLKINIKKGVQKLNGNQAMQVVRFRDGPNGYANGDLGRIETQQGFLKAVVQQCLSLKNVTRINELAKVFTDNVKTNLTINNLAWFAQQAVGGLKMENVHFYTMPCENARVWSRSYNQKLSYVVPKTEELVDLVNQCFNPYVDPLKSNELDIMKLNSDGTIASTTGKLEDSKANASLKSSGSSKTATSNKDDTSTTKDDSTSSTTPTTKTSTSGTKSGSTKTTGSSKTSGTKSSSTGDFTVVRPSDKPATEKTETSTDTKGTSDTGETSGTTGGQDSGISGASTGETP